MFMRSVDSQMRTAESEPLAREIIELMPRAELQSTLALETRQVLALILARHGECEGPEAELRDCWKTAERVYGSSHSTTLRAKSNLVIHLLKCLTRTPADSGPPDYSEATKLMHEVVQGFEALDSADAFSAMNSMIQLSRALRKAGQLDEAEPYARDAADLVVQRFGANHNLNIRAQRELAEILYLKHQFAQAAAAAQRSVSIAVEVYGAGHPNTLAPMSQALPMLDAAGENEPGERLARELHECFKAMGGHDDQAFVRYRAWLARFLTRQGRTVESQDVINQAQQALVAGVNDETRALLALAAGQLACRLGQLDAAEQQYLMALEISPQSPLTDPVLRAKAMTEIVELYETFNMPDRAAPYQQKLQQLRVGAGAAVPQE
jgi:tetratricopeptide (TPR) repeat protein